MAYSLSTVAFSSCCHAMSNWWVRKAIWPVIPRLQKLHFTCGHNARAGSGVVRIDPLHFLAGCHTRRLNEAISVLYLRMFYCVVVY